MAKRHEILEMELYHELLAYKDTYTLTVEIFEYARDFSCS